MQPDASAKKILNYETKWLSLDLQCVGNPDGYLACETGIGNARHSKLQNMFKMLCN